MNLQRPGDQIQFLQANPFSKKRILLVDDNEGYRMTMKAAAEEIGHIIAFDTNNLTDALIALPDLSFNVAVLDCQILESSTSRRIKIDGGLIIAETIARIDPTIGIFSISNSWSGIWDDPRYDPTHPNENNRDYDHNGRREHRGPDFFAQWVSHDVKQIAQLIGHYTPQERDEYELAMLESMPKITSKIKNAKTHCYVLIPTKIETKKCKTNATMLMS